MVVVDADGECGEKGKNEKIAPQFVNRQASIKAPECKATSLENF